MDKYNSIEEKFKTMNIKDYLHLYLGCEVQVRKKDRNKEWLTGIIVEVTKNSNHGDWIDVKFSDVVKILNQEWEESASNFHTYFIGYDEIKPILRPLSDMTDEEKVRVYLWEYSIYKTGELIKNDSDKDFFIVKNENGMRCYVNQHHFSAETTRKLLKAGFDLFRLIEAGLAIDKTKLNSDNNEVK